MPKKQKDGRYRAKIVVAKGEKPVWISARTVRELETKKRSVRETRIDGAKPRDVTFHALVIEWFEVVKKPRIKTRSTLANYQNAINLHLLPCFPEKQLVRAVRRADLQRCLDACAGRSATPCKLVHSIMTHVMKYALSERLIAVDPSAALTLPACRPSKPKDAFTPDQAEKLLAAAAASPDGLMIYLLYYTGIRRGEMLGLQWGDIDWEKHLIHIQRSVDFSAKKAGESQPFSPLKTAASDRYVPIPESLEGILLPLRGQPQALLIPLRDNEPLTASEYRLRWNRLMLAAGFAQLSSKYHEKAEKRRRSGDPPPAPQLAHDYEVSITPHWFRHNYITACVAAGIPAEVTMRIVGHSSYQTTINIYTHLQVEQFRTAAISLSGVFRGERCQKVAGAASSAEA